MKAVLAVVLIVAGAFGFLFVREQAALKEARAELEQLRGEKETATATNEQAAEAQKSGAQATPAEVERMKADQREAIRLRGEVASLKREVEEANKAAIAAEKVRRFQQQKKELLQQNGAGGAGAVVPGETFNTQVSSTMPPGRTMIIGGWETQPGKKTYALVTPTVTENGTNSLTIDAKWISIPSELAEKYASLFPTDQEPVGPEQVAQLVKTLKDTGQMDFLNAPRLTTLSGQRGRISAGGQFGPQVDFQPTLSADGKQIQLNLDAKATAVSQEQPK